MDTISTWDAIAQMRDHTRHGVAFEIQFEGYDYSKKKYTGLHRIGRCVLRSAPSVDKDQFAEHKLYLYDLDNQENRTAWQSLITGLNNQKVVLR